MSEFRRLLVNLAEDEHRGELLQKMRRLLTPDSQVELFSCVYSAGLDSSHLFDADGRQHAIQSVLRKVEKGLQSHMTSWYSRRLRPGRMSTGIGIELKAWYARRCATSPSWCCMRWSLIPEC